MTVGRRLLGGLNFGCAVGESCPRGRRGPVTVVPVDDPDVRRNLEWLCDWFREHHAVEVTFEGAGPLQEVSQTTRERLLVSPFAPRAGSLGPIPITSR